MSLQRSSSADKLQRSSSLSTLNLTLERKSSAESPSPVMGGQFIHNGLAVDGQGSLAVTQISAKPSTGLSETRRKIKRAPPMPPPAITAPAPSTTFPESGRLSVKAQGKQPMALGREVAPRTTSELASPKYVDVPQTRLTRATGRRSPNAPLPIPTTAPTRAPGQSLQRFQRRRPLVLRRPRHSETARSSCSSMGSAKRRSIRLPLRPRPQCHRHALNWTSRRRSVRMRGSQRS